MTTLKRIAVWIIAALAVAEGAALAFLLARGRWQQNAEASAMQRGEAVAKRMGCFGCHGPGGAVGIPNPGTTGGSVPSWTGGNWMMYNDKESDVRAWIVDGHPPGHKLEEGALIPMPAFGSRLTPQEVDDLTAYVLAVSLFGTPQDEQVAHGRSTAVQLGCFGCHGPEGRGFVTNPGSFRGYIPPWEGDDYAELVQNDAEFGQWVRNGISDRFRSNPAARRILESQAIQMPAYGNRVSDKDLAGLRAYVEWTRHNPRNAR
jgi:mono/diheme cytochrome c family protein